MGCNCNAGRSSLLLFHTGHARMPGACIIDVLAEGNRSRGRSLACPWADLSLGKSNIEAGRREDGVICDVELQHCSFPDPACAKSIGLQASYISVASILQCFAIFYRTTTRHDPTDHSHQTGAKKDYLTGGGEQPRAKHSTHMSQPTVQLFLKGAAITNSAYPQSNRPREEKIGKGRGREEEGKRAKSIRSCASPSHRIEILRTVQYSTHCHSTTTASCLDPVPPHHLGGLKPHRRLLGAGSRFLRSTVPLAGSC